MSAPTTISTSESSGMNRWVLRIGYLLCGLTFLLIVWGGHVNTTRSGMAFPDWPTSNAAPMVTYSPAKWLMEGDKFWEHGHRLFASLVGLVTTILMVLAYRSIPVSRRPTLLVRGLIVSILAIIITAVFGFNDMPAGFMETFMAVLAVAVVGFLFKSTRVVRNDRILWLSFAAFSLVCLQGAFGGYTVRNNLPDWTSTTHAMLAEIFLMIVIGITYLAKKNQGSELAHRSEKVISSPSSSILRPLISVSWGLTFIQFFLGALTRHTDAWAVSASWPQWSSEGFFPDASLFQYGQVVIHFAHRTMAYLVAAFVVWQWWAVRQAHGRSKSLPSALVRTTTYAALVVFIQIVLGAAILWTSRGEIITTAHVMMGVGLLALNTIALFTVSGGEYNVGSSDARHRLDVAAGEGR